MEKAPESIINFSVENELSWSESLDLEGIPKESEDSLLLFSPISRTSQVSSTLILLSPSPSISTQQEQDDTVFAIDGISTEGTIAPELMTLEKSKNTDDSIIVISPPESPFADICMSPIPTDIFCFARREINTKAFYTFDVPCQYTYPEQCYSA